MNTRIDQVFGRVVRRRREKMAMSQAQLARKMGCPQASISRLERGRRSASLRELLSLARALRSSVSDLLAELEPALRPSTPAFKPRPEHPGTAFSPAFHAALVGEEAAISQLAAHGVSFPDGPARPAVFKLSLEETLLAALAHAHDARVFEALPALLARHAKGLDWSRLATGAFMLQFQNRLGAVVAGALELKASLSAPRGAWETLREVHERLAKARLDREEVVGPRPKTEDGLQFLRERTPPWMRFWHLAGDVQIRSAGTQADVAQEGLVVGLPSQERPQR